MATRHEVLLPVMVKCSYAGAPVVINIANVTYVRRNPNSTATGVYFVNGDSHVIDQSAIEFAALSARALEAAGQ